MAPEVFPDQLVNNQPYPFPRTRFTGRISTLGVKVATYFAASPSVRGRSFWKCRSVPAVAANRRLQLTNQSPRPLPPNSTRQCVGKIASKVGTSDEAIHAACPAVSNNSAVPRKRALR